MSMIQNSEFALLSDNLEGTYKSNPDPTPFTHVMECVQHPWDQDQTWVYDQEFLSSFSSGVTLGQQVNPADKTVHRLQRWHKWAHSCPRVDEQFTMTQWPYL